MELPGGVPWKRFATYLLLPLLLLLGAVGLVATGLVELGSDEAVLVPTAPELSATDPVSHLAADKSGDLPVLDVVLGEWDVAASASVVPSGPLLISFSNAGTLPHAVRIRSEGPGPRIEWRASPVPPGASGTLTVDLPDGRYTLDCPIEDGHGEHDALGMEVPLEVRHGALSPASATEEPVAAEDLESSAKVTIEAFVFRPAAVRVQAGEQVTWSNRDRAAHTASGESWGTEALDQGDVESISFPRPGRYPYLCTLHPAMTGTVIVEP